MPRCLGLFLTKMVSTTSARYKAVHRHPAPSPPSSRVPRNLLMAKPQIVLIPGAWHKPECFSIIIPKLEAHGYTVHTRQMPSVTESDPPTDLSRDVAAARDLVTKAIGGGNDVVVVPHSWAGLVAGSAFGGMGKKEREAKGEKGGIVRAAYMCAFMAPEGVSLLDAIQHQIPDWWYIGVRDHHLLLRCCSFGLLVRRRGYGFDETASSLYRFLFFP